MRINVNSIQAMAECPAYYQFLKRGIKKPVKKQISIVEKVVKACYLQASRTTYKSNWHRIVTHVDKETFLDINVHNKEEMIQARSTSEHALVWLRQWYNTIYLPEEGTGYIDVPVRGQVGHYTIEATIPVIKLIDKPIILYIDDIATNVTQMYNNLSLRILMWLITETLQSDIVGAQHLTMGPIGGFQNVYIDIARKDSSRILKIVRQIAEMIEKNYSFPSVTEKCSTCPFVKGCII